MLGLRATAANTPGNSLSQPLTSEPNSCIPVFLLKNPGAPAAPRGGAQMSEAAGFRGQQGEPGCAEVNQLVQEEQEVGTADGGGGG